MLDTLSKAAFDKMENTFSFAMRQIGPMFIIVLYGLIWYFTFYYFYFIGGVMHMTYPFVISFGYHLLVLYTFFSVIFNHVMACIVHPGNIRNLRKDIQLLKMKNHYNTDNSNSMLKRRFFKTTKPSLEMSQLMKFRFEDVSSLNIKNWDLYWTKWKDIKLTRAHHWSICNDCIFLMDHHWPWINNWLGLNNLRYFLLFLFYLMFAWVIAPFSIVTWMYTPGFAEEYSALLRFSLTMWGLLGTVMVGFNGWNWYLWLLGDSTIEYWQLKAKEMTRLAKTSLNRGDDSQESVDLYDPDDHEYQRFKSICDNMFKTFGTRNLFAMMLPSI